MVQEWVYDAASAGAAPLRLSEACDAASAGKQPAQQPQECASDAARGRRRCRGAALLHCAARRAGSTGKWLASGKWQAAADLLLAVQRVGEGGVVSGPLVGIVRRSSHESFAAGDWVFARGPWRTEFAASPAELVKIDTRLVSEMR